MLSKFHYRMYQVWFNSKTLGQFIWEEMYCKFSICVGSTIIHESSMSLTNVWYFLGSMWKDFYLLPCRKFPVTGEVNICCIFAWITAFFHYSRLLYCHVVDLRWGSSIILINFTWLHNRLCPWTPPPPRVHFLKWKKLIVFCAQCSILYFENVSLVLCLSPPIKRFFFVL